MQTNRNMNQESQALVNDLGTLSEDAHALLTATADIAGEKVVEARKRLAVALESGKALAGRVRAKALEGAKVADEAVRENPYASISIAFGVGALIGFLMARRGSSNRD